MSEYILKTNNLTKTYHGVTALSNVSLTLKAGKIYGLIGENGAGKTTFMRLVTGLAFPTSGTMDLFGHTGERELQLERKRIGSMIEYPSIILNMTSKENLRFYRLMRGIPNESIEDELLELVGLNETGNKKVSNFSLGMKQRLGIAIALIGNPELIILDEPVNGLDPLGVVEVRNLLKKLCEERQMTILISSHNLPELYQTATDYIIIHKGEVKETLTLEELEECCRHHIKISCSEIDRLVSILETKLNTSNYKVMPNKTVKLYDYLNDTEMVARVIIENGIISTHFSSEGDTLEDYFISIIGGEKDV
jgi:ABC-2 type transport system ATP-binding protein